jgi:hypothetical protein
MKKLLTLVFALLALEGSNLAQAQKNSGKMEIAAGGTFGKPKIVPNATRLALAQIAVNYKVTSTVKVVGKEKSSGTIAGAKLTAFLETTDGKLTDADFQEITDHFYNYFQRKLHENGTDSVAWGTITATDFYTTADEQVPATEKGSTANVWYTRTARNGNVMYSGNIGFALGKIKRASKFCKQIGAPAAFLNLTVDFADILLDVDVRTGSYSGYYTVTKTRAIDYNSAVKANVKVIPSELGTNSLFWNEKDGSEMLLIREDLGAGTDYADNVSQDPSRMKHSAWAFSKEMQPVVIETTREKYKAAAKASLEAYADTFIQTQKSLKK